MIKEFQRAEELRNLLNKACHAYYVLDAPLMEDAIYDSLYRELLNLEKENQSLIKEDSPTQRIGGKPAKEFLTIKHRLPMHSLENAFSFEEVCSWYSKIERLIDKERNNSLNINYSLIGELKIDGNALALSYQDGVLIKASTRGDGKSGEEITANARTITSIPLRLQIKDPPPWLEVRGEAFIPHEIFTLINQERKNSNNNLFANPRNACSGTLRQLNPRIVASRKLDFFAYTIHLPEDWSPRKDIYKNPQDQWEALQWLKNIGFKVEPNAKRLRHLSDMKKFLNHWESCRFKLPYATDGVVIKINEFNIQKSVGFTQKAPRWAIAIKYPAEEVTSKLKSITYQVGRTGVITPVAEFQTISLAGTQVSRATLHNADRINSLDLHLGDTIVVRKAGEIIPEVVRVLKELRLKKPKKIEIPLFCPECNSKLVRDNKEVAIRCINHSCPAILKGSIKHWVSKSSMNIDGLGSKLIDQLVDRRIVKSISKLYELDEKSLIELERMGSKSAKNIIEAIAISKSQSWSKQLFGLGINLIGEGVATTLSKNFSSISELEKTALYNPEKIQLIYGIGKEIAQSIQDWFKEPKNQLLVSELKNVGLSLEANQSDIEIENLKKSSISKSVDGKTFVITGVLESFNRSEAKALIENAGGKVISSVSKNISYLVAGENPGSKFQKGKELGIKIISEEDLKRLIIDSPI